MILVGFISFLVYLTILVVIGWSINQLLAPLFGRLWRLIVAPGVIVHELSHALACILTDAPIHDLNFWKPSGGHVVHGPPRLHLIGPVLIGFAPLIVMTLGLFLVAPFLTHGLPEIGWTQTLPQSIGAGVLGYLTALRLLISHLNWLSIEPWLLLYGMLNVAVTIAPSAADFGNAKGALVALLLLFVLLSQLLAIRVPLESLWPPVATSLLFLGLILLIAGLIRGLVALVRLRFT